PSPGSAKVTGGGGLILTLSSRSSGTPSVATATATASYCAHPLHDARPVWATFTIGRATTTTAVTCGSSPFVYNGSAYTPCTAKVTGAGGLDQVLTVSYGDNTNADTATASAAYQASADPNYFGSNDSQHFTI